MKQMFIFVLMINAAWVCIRQYRKENAWPFIVSYWFILTLKNAYDFFK